MVTFSRKGGRFMKIAIIAPVVLPILGRDQDYGGIESVISVVSEELMKVGHKVTLFASGDSKTSAKLVRTVARSLGQGQNFEAEKKANRLAYNLVVKEGPDVIWDHTIAVHAHEVKSDKSKFIFKNGVEFLEKELVDTDGIPVIHTIHGPAKEHMPEIVRKLSAAGHYFVCISKDQASGFLPHIRRGHFLGVIYNPVNLHQFTSAKEKTGNFFFWIGRFCMEKGPHIAIEVAKKTGIPLKLAGKMSEKHERDYFNKFIKPRLGKYAEFLGSISTAEKLDLFAQAKAFLMTNIWAEPFGLVAAEALASGTPVVGPDFGSLREVVGNAGILVPVRDIEMSEEDTSFTSGQKKYVDRIVKNLENLRRVPPNFPRRRAEQLFSPTLCAERYLESFSLVAKKNLV